MGVLEVGLEATGLDWLVQVDDVVAVGEGVDSVVGVGVAGVGVAL